MGMSASQGMLFTLVSSRSDLELQAQGITNDRMVLSRQQEGIAKKYADAVSNRQLMAKVTEGDKVNSINLTLDLLFNNLGYGICYKGIVYMKNPKGDQKSLADLKALLHSECTGQGEEENILQYLLISGEATLMSKDGQTEQSLSGVTDIYETYYTGDDAEAKGLYDTELAKVQRKDKSLEVDLQHIETEHKAVDENIESVRKVIDKNIESSVVFNG